MTNKPISPKAQYRLHLQKENFVADEAQEKAIEELELLYERLLERWDSSSNNALSKWLSSVTQKKATPIIGLYFWGGVGRGKTYLMDIFYESLPFEEKMRTHFHRFMRRIHHELKLLDNEKDPLVKVAGKIAEEAKVICFDEFFVSDITDAMILANLLEALFERNVVLVTTSNIIPDELYKDGLQRARFLPAIELLKQHTRVVNVDGGIDYRLRTLEKTKLYHCPISADSHSELEKSFGELITDSVTIEENISIEIEGREIKAIKVADDVAWFHFRALCDGPRSQNDYIELAREYHAVIVEGVPELGEKNDDMAKRFIYLVDEFYDRNVKLIISAEKPIIELYGKGRAEFEFQRTISRLQEMQSKEYLKSAHKAH